jgi:alginate O-acetyltransferase complex protein AlgI
MTLEALALLFVILILSCAARFIPSAAPRQLLLLSCSYFIYAQWAGAGFLLILIASSLVNYLLGAALRRRPTVAMLWVGIGANVLLLSIFKYVAPLASPWPGALADLVFLSRIVLPLGISFWTFQAISYLVDIYLEKEADPSIVEFCLYMAFWPTVVAGPVCRLPRLLPQFRKQSPSVRDDFSVGLVRIVQGLFMKALLSQLLASGLTQDSGVVAGFDKVTSGWSGLDVWALALGYAFQLFFDFAGYSHIVIGAARLLGFRLQENFDRPYLSSSPSVFWTRWHMSLSFWIRDYVYSPIAAMRRETWWPHAALLISMVIFGFWHDARSTYVLWGVYHGALLVGHRMGQRLKQRIAFKFPYPLGPLLSWGATFALVLFGYILFRSNSLEQCVQMVQAVLRPGSYGFSSAQLPSDYYRLVLIVVLGYFAVAGVQQLITLWTAYKTRLAERMTSPSWNGAALVIDATLRDKKWWWLAPGLVVLLAATALSFFGQTSSIAPFIYTLF